MATTFLGIFSISHLCISWHNSISYFLRVCKGFCKEWSGWFCKEWSGWLLCFVPEYLLCGAKLPFLFSFLSYLLSGNDNFLSEKREERKEKREEYKKKRQSSVENCRFFLWLQNEKDIWGKWWMVLNPRDFLMIYRWRDMIYSWCRMIYFRFAQIWYNIRSFIREAYIIHRRWISYRRYITRSVRNGYHCKNPLCLGRQKRVFTWWPIGDSNSGHLD